MRPVSSFACALGLCLAIVSAATAQQPQPPSPARPDSAHPRSRPGDSLDVARLLQPCPTMPVARPDRSARDPMPTARVDTGFLSRMPSPALCRRVGPDTAKQAGP